MMVISARAFAFGVFLSGASTPIAASTLTIDTSDRDGFQFDTILNDSNTGIGKRTASEELVGKDVARDPLVLDKFDPALGTITAIDVSWRASAGGFSLHKWLVCRDSGFNSACEDESSSQIIEASSELDLPGDGRGFVSNTSTGTYAVAADDFSNFIGPGTLLVPWRIGYTHKVTGFCDPNTLTVITQCEVEGSARINFSASATVTYTYKMPAPPPPAVPAPASGLLLVGSLAVLVLRRRR